MKFNLHITICRIQDGETVNVYVTPEEAFTHLREYDNVMVTSSGSFLA